MVGSKLLGYPVLSLHVGGEIARTKSPIIDPDGLKVIGYSVDGPLIRGEIGNILDIGSIREFSNRGMIIDSIDEFVFSGDIVRLDKVMALNFNLVGLKVVTKDGKTLGKVSDYTVDTDSFMVYQLVVKRPVMKSLLDPELTINRSQITEIDDYKVTIKNEDEKVTKSTKKEKVKDFTPNFVNPFREPQFSQSHNQNLDEPGTE